ncbi:MAG: hypothetical protein IKM20_06070, partial [Erysipelotrichales bacterium]|nr:hypothetical protein [Erysipelotrichales bacterium]
MREVISLNRKWAFSKESVGIPTSIPNTWNWVNIPHSWNAIDGQDGDNDYYRGTCYYVKEIEKIDLPEAKQYYLEFCGANSSADVYVNGKKLGHHDDGYSTFRVNITEALDVKNLIVVAVDNAANETVYPQMADFTFYGGIYRNVNLICVDESHFDLDYYGGPGVKVTPTVVGKDAKVEVETYVTNKKAGQTLVYTVTDKEGNVVATKECADKRVEFELTDVTLWHARKNPYLYSLKVELVEEGKVLDTVNTRFGCRTFKIDPEKGFILNGESYPLHGVSRHQDRWGIGNAL